MKDAEESGAALGRRRGRRGLAVLAVFLVDGRAYLLERLAFVHHLHHVTRDADTDRSAEAHAIEYRFFWGRVIMKVT